MYIKNLFLVILNAVKNFIAIMRGLFISATLKQILRFAQNDILAALLLPILLISCTERYDFKLQDTESKLVIIGYVCTEKGQYAIDITRTRSYFEAGSMRDVPSAKVYINDEELTPDPEIKSRYLTRPDFSAVTGQTYTLRVEMDFNGDGQIEVYTAEAVAPKKVFAFMKLQPLTNEADGPALPLTTLLVFQDPKGEDNNYGAHLYISTARDSNDTYHKYHISNTPSKYVTNMFKSDVADGELIFYPAYMIGRKLLYKPLDTLMVYPFDTIEVEFNCHSKEYYEFIRQCDDAASGSNPMFMTPAGPVTGNVSGGAIGAFGVYTNSRSKGVVPYKEGTWKDEDLEKRFGKNWREVINGKLKVEN